LSSPPDAGGPAAGRAHAARLLLAPATAVAAAFAFDLPRIGAAALVGASVWLGLRLAGKRLPLQFYAFAMFGAVIFGFMAAVFAALADRSVYQMLAMPWSQQFVGITLALAAVAFGALALVGGLVTLLFGGPPADDAGPGR
jgi:hypothetical protein